MDRDLDLDLNTSASLPDGTAASQRPPHPVGQHVTAAEIKRGYQKEDVEPTNVFARDDAGGEEPVGNPFTVGGFLKRPRGTAR